MSLIFTSYSTDLKLSRLLLKAFIKELEQEVLEPVAAVSYFCIWAVALDLSDLGLLEGEGLERLELRSAEALSETEVGSRNCWLLDPAFVAGLPTD